MELPGAARGYAEVIISATHFRRRFGGMGSVAASSEIAEAGLVRSAFEAQPFCREWRPEAGKRAERGRPCKSAHS
jgi:hypothetical protein